MSGANNYNAENLGRLKAGNKTTAENWTTKVVNSSVKIFTPKTVNCPTVQRLSSIAAYEGLAEIMIGSTTVEW